MVSSKSPAGPGSQAPRSLRTADLSPFHKNPRRGNVAVIVESLKKHGQYKPLVVNVGSLTGRPYEVLVGNHTLQAGLQIGMQEMLVHLVDVNDDEASRIVLVDNRASDKGTYNNEDLAGLLTGLDGLDGTGYSDGDLTRLLNGLEDSQETLTDPDVAPPVPKKPITQEGDVWLLGPHRLVCGNSRDADVVRLAAGGFPVDAMWTDPPYGVDYVGKTKDKMTIQGDGAAGLRDLLDSAFHAARTVLKAGAPIYVAHADTERVNFEGAFRDAGFIFRQNLIWVKNTLVLGRSDYHYKHEPILEGEAPDELDEEVKLQFDPVLYGFAPEGEGRLGRGGDRWYGNNKQTTVFEVDKPTSSRLHPTMKPVELIEAHLRNSVQRGGTVLDLFGGSGSTVIACHRLSLHARVVELDAKYCDVICRRYQEATGVMPLRAGANGDDEAVDFTAESA